MAADESSKSLNELDNELKNREQQVKNDVPSFNLTDSDSPSPIETRNVVTEDATNSEMKNLEVVKDDDAPSFHLTDSDCPHEEENAALKDLSEDENITAKKRESIESFAEENKCDGADYFENARSLLLQVAETIEENLNQHNNSGPSSEVHSSIVDDFESQDVKVEKQQKAKINRGRRLGKSVVKDDTFHKPNVVPNFDSSIRVKSEENKRDWSDETEKAFRNLTSSLEPKSVEEERVNEKKTVQSGEKKKFAAKVGKRKNPTKPNGSSGPPDDDHSSDPAGEPYSSSRKIRFDLKNPKTMFNKLLLPILEIKRCPDPRSKRQKGEKLTDNEVTLIEIKKDKNILKFFMLNSNLYMVAVALSQNMGTDYGKILELVDKNDNGNKILSGSMAMGENFEMKYSGKNWRSFDFLRDLTISQAFDYVRVILSERVNAESGLKGLTVSEQEAMKRSLEILMFLVAESCRNLWVAHKFWRVLNEHFVIDDMHLDLVKRLIWRWGKHSRRSRESGCCWDLSAEAMKLWVKRDIRLLKKAHAEHLMVCERMITMKNYSRQSDFDGETPRFEYIVLVEEEERKKWNKDNKGIDCL